MKKPVSQLLTINTSRVVHTKDAQLYRANFFTNPKNKTNLFKPVCSHFQADECRNLFEILLIINSVENIQSSITKETIEVFPITKHEQADTRLIFHGGMSNESTVVVAKDTDMFLLLNYALGQLECFLPAWYMKIGFNQFIKGTLMQI